MLNGIDLFSGIGAMALGLSGLVKPVIYCEKDEYAQKVLRSNMQKGVISSAGIIKDVRLVSRKTVGPVCVDVVYGGFPCQDISTIGMQKGLQGERSGLVSEVYRIVKEFKPAFIILENVPAVVSNGLEEIVKNLHTLGYDASWDIVSAEMFGAPHIRKRWVLVAKLRGNFVSTKSSENNKSCYATTNKTGEIEDVGNSTCGKSKQIKRVNKTRSLRPPNTSCIFRKKWMQRSWYATEPSVGRMAYGSPGRTKRHHTLGNAVPPVCIRFAFLKLMILTF